MRTFRWNRFVPVILVGLSCATGVRALALADDGNDKPPAKPATTKIAAPAPLTERERLLLDRVEQLEKRVADLEGKTNPSTASGADAAAVQPASTTPAASTAGVAAPGTASGAIASATSGTTPVNTDLVAKDTTAVVPSQATEKCKSGAAKPGKTDPFTFAD